MKFALYLSRNGYVGIYGLNKERYAACRIKNFCGKYVKFPLAFEWSIDEMNFNHYILYFFILEKPSNV